MAHLLIVDDDSQNTQALTELLRREGHDVATASSAGEALRCLVRATPDLVLLDLGLPTAQGLELLEALRDEPRYAGIPVAVYTGHDEPEVRRAAQRLGACDFIAKGQNWPATRDRIARCLNGTATGV